MQNFFKTCHASGRTFLLFLSFIMAGNCFAQKQGQGLIDSILRELPRQKEDTNNAELLNNLSYAYFTINPNEGLKYGQQGLDLAEKLHWKRGIAVANQALGINYNAKSNNAKALEYWQKALKIFEETGNRQGIASVTGDIGIVYVN